MNNNSSLSFANKTVLSTHARHFNRERKCRNWICFHISVELFSRNYSTFCFSLFTTNCNALPLDSQVCKYQPFFRQRIEEIILFICLFENSAWLLKMQNFRRKPARHGVLDNLIESDECLKVFRNDQKLVNTNVSVRNTSIAELTCKPAKTHSLRLHPFKLPLISAFIICHTVLWQSLFPISQMREIMKNNAKWNVLTENIKAESYDSSSKDFLNCNLKQFAARDWDWKLKIRCVIQLMKFIIEKNPFLKYRKLPNSQNREY